MTVAAAACRLFPAYFSSVWFTLVIHLARAEATTFQRVLQSDVRMSVDRHAHVPGIICRKTFSHTNPQCDTCLCLSQLYPQYVDANITVLIPLMMSALSVQPFIDKHYASHKTVGPQLKQLYTEFIMAQVKVAACCASVVIVPLTPSNGVQTLSFLTYVLRGFSSKMQDHREALARVVIQLLANCPQDAVNSRKVTF